MTILPQEELLRICKDFYEPEWEGYSEEKKNKIFENYRKAEAETNQSIEKHCSVEAWYASGEGRLLNLNI